MVSVPLQVCCSEHRPAVPKQLPTSNAAQFSPPPQLPQLLFNVNFLLELTGGKISFAGMVLISPTTILPSAPTSGDSTTSEMLSQCFASTSSSFLEGSASCASHS